jgi:glycosyltransferase involved in cell wall biosynthesis
MISSKTSRILAERFGRSHPEVILAATYWVLNGVNIFSANLVRGLCGQGIPGQVLLTEEDTALVQVNEPRMSKPSDIPFHKLPVRPRTSWGGHWGAMIRYLEERAPCIYIPNSDWRHSCVSPLLSNKVGIVGIVHSDDPLHYDHVSRLGQYWNAIITTSRTIAEKTAALNPSLTDRITVIPIGVDIPFTPPKERAKGDRPLRVIYHGVLKQHQKRILDLEKITSELAARKVPVELSIAGGGPDEEPLKKACKEWVEQGAIRFLGIVPHETIFDLLEQNDVYILTSEFEGMPNALLEAMGRGCVPVVTNVESAIPQLVQDGQNGFVVPIGDIGAFADRLTLLQRDHSLGQQMALNAYETVNRGKYRTQDMVQDYIEVFDRVLSGAHGARFQRMAGSLIPPPAEIAGVSIFPVALSHRVVEEIGLFPTRHQNYREFKEQIRLLEAPKVPSLIYLKQQPGFEKLKDVRVVVASPSWTYTGVNEFSANLVRGLMSKGIRGEILLTEENTDLVNVSEPRMPRPSDIPFVDLPVDRVSSWGAHWGAMIRYLEERAPCIYIPNYDWRHSCVSPLLSNRVAVVGVAHQDDLLYYDHAQRLGRYWNAIVAISDTIAEKIKSLDPTLGQRTTVIPHGPNIPGEAPNRAIDPAAPLTVVWQGRFEDRELEMMGGLIRILREREVPTEISVIAPAGKCRRDILDYLSEPDTVRAFDDLPQDQVLTIFENTDVVVFASEFEGARNRLAEAMGRSCIPVVVDNEGLVKNGENGFLLPAIDIESLADRLTLLRRDPSKRHAMSLNAHDTASSMVYPCSEMIEDYIDVLSVTIDQIHRRKFRRPPGILQPPPAEVNGVGILPLELSYKVARVGLFPAQSPDYAEFKAQRPVRKFKLFRTDILGRTLGKLSPRI